MALPAAGNFFGAAFPSAIFAPVFPVVPATASTPVSAVASSGPAPVPVPASPVASVFFGAAFPSGFFSQSFLTPATAQSSPAPIVPFRPVRPPLAPPGVPGVPQPDPIRSPTRDREVLKRIAAAIEATGQFDRVVTHSPTEDAGASAEMSRLCGLELKTFEETDGWNDAGNISVQRTVHYLCTILARDIEPDVRDDLCDLLYAAAANAAGGRSVGGQTFADMTHLTKGKYFSATPPTRKLECDGVFVYDVPGWGSHDDQS